MAISEITPAPAECIRLPYRAPWNWQQFQRHFSLRLVPHVERLGEHYYARSFRLEGRAGWLKVRALADDSALELCVSGGVPADVVAPLARRMFDLDADPASIDAHLARDPLMAPLVENLPGLRLPVAFDPFEQAVRAIINQQITVKAAVTLTGRLVERLGERLPAPEGMPDRLFPTPAQVAQGSLEDIGIPRKRVKALQDFAGAVADGGFRLDITSGSDDLIARLCALPGIGPWTAEYIALRAFGQPDAFPAADLGLLKSAVWGPSGINAKDLRLRAEAWKPWRAYAAMHLWSNYADKRAPSHTPDA